MVLDIELQVIFCRLWLWNIMFAPFLDHLKKDFVCFVCVGVVGDATYR